MNREIVDAARRLIRRAGTGDPFDIARELGVSVRFERLGSLKGMYAVIKRNRYIVISDGLDEYTQKLVCAHELGHDQLHRALARDRWLQEFMIFNMNQRPEYEANVFASELLLPDADILEYADGGLDIEQVAKAMNSDVNLVALKLATLSRRGYSFRQFEYRDDFLRE
jgi:Zn-dependent peptidase ImmA (M78 family)